MAKASDYRTIARALGPVYIRARLVNDETLYMHLYRAMEDAIAKARRLAELELRAKG